MALDPTAADRPRPKRPGVRIGAVVSRFHEDLTGAMLRSAKDELVAAGMEEDGMVVVHAPGAFELPLIARRLARRKDIDAVLCFGLVLTGETTHDHWVAMGATQGITMASMETDKPILFGVLTCQSLEQARSRALPESEGGKEDKGREVARAALESLEALDACASKPSKDRMGF
ncbi:MAG: 6,7-dimethyl-8-ribityllumazine synthase [Planctomycetota bacterium]|nr:6,7-dimethyl-8-ribityllumazine synthase [Planctomycetota bacterium]MEC8495960.1 6,7-dimethyl-8-ribityllumazine synthase [Planctomycetota bacterium]MEC8512978.1 6,7-dimethyl-8-ribityllumazine synthase [Planctomycetota bacterium]